jgi:hypothetical protein
MDAIAETGNGTFSYIERADQVGDAFATCLGGMLSVFAQNINMVITPAPRHGIAKMHTSYDVSSTDCKGAHKGSQVSIPDMFCDEKRDIVFELSLPRVGSPILQLPIFSIDVSWTDPKSKTRAQASTLTAVMSRPRGAQLGAINIKLDQERNRVVTANALTEAGAAAEAKNLKQAREICDQAIASLLLSPSRASGNVQQLVRDLQDTRSSFRDRTSYNLGGYAKCVSKAKSHWQQRSSDSHTNNAYSTPTMFAQQSRNVIFNRSKRDQTHGLPPSH